MGGTDWQDVVAALQAIIELIESSDIEGGTLDGPGVRVTLRKPRYSGPRSDGGYNMRAYVIRGRGVYQLQMTRRES